jgi:hypothetical protein
MRARLAVLVVGVCLACAGQASAFTPPELYVRLANANSIDHTPQSDWMPLAAAPTLNWLGGYEIGYVFQDTAGSGDPQRAALQVTGAPDGQPTQPYNEPYCSGGPGTVGTIVPVGSKIQFEGSGVYTVRVSVGPPSGGQNDCMTGPESASSTGTFTVDAPVVPSVFGSPLAVRSKPPASDAFVGVRTVEPPGGTAETRCARDASVNPDGSVTGSLVAPAADDGPRTSVLEEEFARPGAWTCVSRGVKQGVDENFDDRVFGTPWSAPLQVDVRSDFRRSKGVISKASTKQPQFRFTAEFPEAAGGGKGELTLKKLTRCKGATRVFKKVGKFKGTFDSKGRATVKIKRPSAGYYTGTLAFGGTRFYTKSVDPNLALLRVSRSGKLSYVSGIPGCPGFG